MSAREAVLITGGAKRVGAAFSRYFAKNGYDVALHYHQSQAEAVALKAEIEALGATCQLFRHDLSDTPGIPALIKEVRELMPRTVALINNASVFERSPLADTDEALFDLQFDVNLKAPFFLTQAYAKAFGSGCVINILDTDIAQVQGSHFAYLLSKKALADFTPMAALTLGPKIRVNGVCPGSMLPSNQNEAEYEKKMEAIVPMRSHPSLDELAEAVRWLIQQKHITGQIVFVDGGKHVL